MRIARQPTAPLPPRLTRGFSLIELTLALATTLMLTTMLFHLFHHNERVIRDQTLIIEMQQSARVVAAQIADEIRMAGQGVPVYAAGQDAAMAECIAVILGTSTSSRIDFRAGLSNAEAVVTGALPLDFTLNVQRTISVSDGSVFSTVLGSSIPAGRFVYVWGSTSNSTWAWVRAELIGIGSTSMTIRPRQSSNMEPTIIFTRLPTIALEEAVSLYLSAGSVRRATAADMTSPASPTWAAANEIGKNFSSLNFTYYDKYNNVVAPTTLANRNAIARIDIQLTVQTPSVLTNGTQPGYSLAMRTTPRNLALPSGN